MSGAIGMSSTWGSLVPLIIGSAVVPVQLIITILLLRARAGKITAVAWVAGMTTFRLIQGALFALVLSHDSTTGEAPSSGSSLTAAVLLLVGILFVVTAIRHLLHAPDHDEPPPKWLTMTETMSPLKAFALGCGVMVIGVKFWVFTLGALSIIGDADLGRSTSVATYLAFVVLAQGLHLTAVLVAYAIPARSEALLDGASSWLTDHNRQIMIVIGVVFGIWFVLKGLNGLGVI